MADPGNTEDDAQEQLYRIPLWRQAWEATQKRRVKPGTEGLAANDDRVLRKIGWSWVNALEVKTERRRETTQHPVSQKASGNTEFA